MRSQIPTLLSISEWTDLLGLNPWYVAQYEADFDDGISKCNKVMYEKNWQKRGNLSRYEISRAINQAEDTFADYVGYYPAPKFIVGDLLLYPVPDGSTGYGRPMLDLYDRPRIMYTRYKHVQALGVEVLEEIVMDAPVTLESSIAGDTNGRFRIEIINAPAGLLASEVAVYYAAADRVGGNLDQWEIRPLDITVDGTDLTIEGDAYLLAPPQQTLKRLPAALDILTAENFVDTVDIYRRTIDSDENTALIFKRVKTPITQLSTSLMLNPIQGRIAPIRPDPCIAGGDPDNIAVSYLAGYPRQSDGRMDFRHAQAIAWLSAAYLQCTVCGCACGDDDKLLSKWTSVMRHDKTPLVTKDQIENPFGSVAHGAVLALERAEMLKQELLMI